MIFRKSKFPSRAGTLAALAAALLLASCSVGEGSVVASEENAWVGMHPDEYRDAVLKARHRIDPILALYRSESSRADVVAFFSAIVHSEELARIILSRAEEFDVSPSLAVALVWEESKFDPRASNKNKTSVDRGLFQLNSKSFPKLREGDFYDPDISARFGIAHLRWCLDLAGTEVSGIAMYNAGTTRVRTGGTPKATLDYVSRILTFRDGVEQLFDSELAVRWIIASDGGIRAASLRRTAESRLSTARFPILSASR
ncbi:MAG: transglycosylase [Treponema sp. GWB1_62_6]|nr:MAG: transglycosylase [Treponema sp. GWC1_61_84]OHE67160.1 MAG: transglycosylase [Treponema sp. GWB1_62_6]